MDRLTITAINMNMIANKARVPKVSSRNAREAPSACIYRNRQQIKSLKMVVETTVTSISKVDPLDHDAV